ncbi:ABC transporter permease [Niallia sp. Krafla_26]|uniref:ABC transporter permease n=1 Tax=Niallia sp. Krafla_26 TaxID=3064703 RepID=UPI003D166CB0
MQINFKKSLFVIYSLIELAVLLLLWYVLSLTSWFPSYLSDPVTVITYLLEMFRSGEIFPHISVSLYRTLVGFVYVVMLGTGLGIIAGFFKSIGKFFDPLVSFLNPIPKIALLPVFLVWFGVTDITRILIIFSSAFFPCFIATLDGVRNVNKMFLWSAENMGASKFQQLYKIVLPAALPKIFDGWRVALALTFTMMFSSEMIGTSTGQGLGFLILNADSFGRTDIVIASVAVISLLGLIFDRLLMLVQKRVLWWNER